LEHFMSTIAVTGATGQLGSLIVRGLSGRGHTVVAIARDAAKATALSGDDVEVRVADYSDPAGWDAALSGVDRLVLVSGSEVGQRVAQHTTVVEAAKRAGVQWLAYTSAPHADSTTLVLAPEHKATEEVIARSGLAWTFLRNNWYTENYVGQVAPAAASGELIGSAGRGQVASASRQDFADAAVAVATGEGHDNAVYELAGDVAWTMDDLAAAISEITGRPVTYRNLSHDEHVAALQAAGLDEGTAQFVAALDANIAEGALADASGDLQRLVGRPTTPLVEGLRAALATG
jgi:NAD(P)H dehydrogenase (quinone)